MASYPIKQSKMRRNAFLKLSIAAVLNPMSSPVGRYKSATWRSFGHMRDYCPGIWKKDALSDITEFFPAPGFFGFLNIGDHLLHIRGPLLQGGMVDLDPHQA